jgi:hypothetical protein
VPVAINSDASAIAETPTLFILMFLLVSRPESDFLDPKSAND